MSAFTAFLKKELLDRQRSGRLTVLGILFVLFGIMDPAIAKLTPWLLEVMAEELAASGMTVGTVTVTAMDSWVQFYKNIPMALIVFLCMEAGCFTKEYASGSLIPLLTKGLPRRTVVLAKSLVLTLIFTAGYWVCYGITWGYNAWLWDNSVAQNLGFSAVCWWVFGLWTVSLTVLFSSYQPSVVASKLQRAILVICFSPTVMVMVAIPCPTAVTFPPGDTVTTPPLDDTYETVSPSGTSLT